MIRYYCDVCSNEIDKPEGQIIGTSGRLSFSITRSLDGKWNDGQVCKPCVLAAVIDALEKP